MAQRRRKGQHKRKKEVRVSRSAKSRGNRKPARPTSGARETRFRPVASRKAFSRSCRVSREDSSVELNLRLSDFRLGRTSAALFLCSDKLLSVFSPGGDGDLKDTSSRWVSDQDLSTDQPSLSTSLKIPCFWSSWLGVVGQ